MRSPNFPSKPTFLILYKNPTVKGGVFYYKNCCIKDTAIIL